MYDEWHLGLLCFASFVATQWDTANINFPIIARINAFLRDPWDFSHPGLYCIIKRYAQRNSLLITQVLECLWSSKVAATFSTNWLLVYEPNVGLPNRRAKGNYNVCATYYWEVRLFACPRADLNVISAVILRYCVQ